MADMAHRANFVSVLFGSLTVATFYLVLVLEFGLGLTAIAGSLLLMVSHSLWWHSTIVENYTTSAFILTLCLLAWRQFARTQNRRWLLTLCAFAGLGIFNHVQMGFVCLGVALTGVLYARRTSSWRTTIPLCGAAASVGLLPWLFVLFRNYAQEGRFLQTLKGAFVGSFSDTFFGGAVFPSMYDTSFVFWFQSPTFYLLAFGVAGIVYLYRDSEHDRSGFWGMIAPFVLNTINFCFYPTWDKFAFLLVSFVLLYFFAAFTLQRLVHASRGSRQKRILLLGYLTLSLLLGPYLHTHIATWGLDPKSIWHGRYNNSYSANAYFQSDFVVNPYKRHFVEVDKFARLLFAKLPPDATFLDCDSRTYYPLADYFQQILGLRPDVAILLVNSWGIANWGLGSGELTKQILAAYELDKPFFAISNMAPIHGFMRKAQEREPEIELVKFPLDDEHWVYRLLSKKEKRAQDRPIDFDKSPLFKPSRIQAPRGYFDLSPEHVAFLNSGKAVQQDLSAYEGKWHSQDHLFFEGEKAGSSVDFYLITKDKRTVDLTFWLTAAPDFGIVKAKMFPAMANATEDLFAHSVQQAKIQFRDLHLTPGPHRIQFTVIGKNPKSSNYHFGVDGIEYTTLKIGD